MLDTELWIQECILKKKIFEAEVLDNAEIAPGIFRMRFQTEKAAVSDAVPGQFLNIYPEPGGRLVLPRPFGICGADPAKSSLEIVYEVVGRGTAGLAEARPGRILKIGAPLGRGFDLTGLREIQEQDGRPFVLVGGGVGCGPMLFLASVMVRNGLKAEAVLGFRNIPFLDGDFTEAGCRTLMTTEGFHGNCFTGTVIDCMKVNGITASAYFACGPRGMLAAVDDYVSKDCGDERLQVSLEERMGCGYGVCVGCSIPVWERDGSGETRRIRRKVCKDGPVFRGSEVIWHDGTR